MTGATEVRLRLDRSAAALGVGAAVSPLLGLANQTPPRLVTFGTVGVVVTLVLAVGALTGGFLHLRSLVIAAGAGFLAAAVLQTVQTALGGTGTLGGDGSSVALHLGFAVGLLAVGLAPADSSTVPSGTASSKN